MKEDEIAEETGENEEKKERNYSCKYCSATFDKLYELGNHVKKVHPDKIKRKLKEKKKLESPPPIDKREKEEELFKRPKTATEILREVLYEHRLNERFIDYALRRSERLGGLHPMELQKMLSDLQSGVKEAAVPYIVDDYYNALIQEQLKAQKAGQRISYPFLGQPSQPKGTPTAYQLGYGRTPYGQQAFPTPYDVQPYGQPNPNPTLPPAYYQSFGVNPPVQTAPTLEEIAKVIDEKIEKTLVKQKEEERLERLEREMKQQMEKMEENHRAQMEKILETVSMVNATPEGVLTKEELITILEKKEKDAELKLANERIEMERQLREKEKELDEQRITSMMEKLESAMEELKNREPPVVLSGEGYTKDEYRLIHDGLQLLAGRKPVHDIGQIIVKLQPPSSTETTTGSKALPTEKVEGQGIIEELPDHLILEE